MSPFDPAGGAQRSLNEIARLLAARSWRSSVVATTLSDAASPLDPAAALAARGLTPHVDRAGDALVYRFRDAGVDYTLLDVPSSRRAVWPAEPDPRFDALLEAALRAQPPDVVHTFGAAAAERQRHALCRRHGAAVVLAVRNHGYYDRRAFEHVDAVLTCSRFLSDRYRERIGVESTALPVPIDWPSTLAADHDPIFITYVNPSLDKGVLFFARLADELATARPDLPFMVFESRASAGALLAAGAAGGLDLRRHESIMISPGVPAPRDIFAAARVLLVPSCWDEPAGRVIPEALVNGVPPIVADRGGMPETVGQGGFVLPLPADYTPASRTLPDAASVRAWVDLVVRLCDDEMFYVEQCARARAEAVHWRAEAVGARFDEYFRSVRARVKPLP